MIAIYCRAGDESVLDMQEKSMRTGTELAGVMAADTLVYKDIGGTGKSIDRPGLNQLRAAMKNEDIECVFVWGSDRIATQYDLLAQFLNEAKDAGIKVYAICGGAPEDLEWMLDIKA